MEWKHIDDVGIEILNAKRSDLVLETDVKVCKVFNTDNVVVRPYDKGRLLNR